MELENEKIKYYKKIGIKILILAGILLGIFVAYKVAIFYLPFLIALFIATLLEPILRFFMKKWVTHRNDYFFMGIYVFLIGIWFFLASGMAQLIFEDIAFARALEFFTLLAIPVPVIRHIDSVSQRKYHTVAQLLCYP